MKKLLVILCLLGIVRPLIAEVQDDGSAATEQLTPRGVRNSNPGNLRARDPRSWRHWRGATGTDEQGYLTFRKDVDGLRALVLNLRLYYVRHHLQTVDQIIHRWSNDVPEPGKQSYIQFICHRLQVGPRTKLNMEDNRVLLSLARAIVQFENGKDPYTERTYSRVLSKMKGARS